MSDPAFDPRKPYRMRFTNEQYYPYATAENEAGECIWDSAEVPTGSYVSVADYDALLRMLRETRETLEDVLNQACLGSDGRVDSMALSANRDGLLCCASYGAFVIETHVGRRVIGRWAAQDIAEPMPPQQGREGMR